MTNPILEAEASDVTSDALLEEIEEEQAKAAASPPKPCPPPRVPPSRNRPTSRPRPLHMSRWSNGGGGCLRNY